MLTAVAIIPSAPVLVPELAGAATAELTDLHAAVAAAVAELPRQWMAVGTAEQLQRVPADAVGTFAGYGADIPVAAAPSATQVIDLPLCALIAGWARGRHHPEASFETYCYPTVLDDESAVERGRELRREIEAGDTPTGVLLIADGCNTLTPPAPGGYRPETVPVQEHLDDALAAGDTTALSAFDDAVVGRVAFGVLAGLVGAGPVAAQELYRGAPYGVGYFVGVWRP